MPRPLRIEYPNAWYHVMNRGAGRRKIFRNDHHREIFLSCLEEASEMFGIEIHAYCLMDNHYHLLIRTPNANLSRAMRHINGVYTQRYNRSCKTDGPLFRGRYKAKLIDEDCYLLLVSRYIHLNPTEAKLVSSASSYRWSSYAAYIDEHREDDWLLTSVIKQHLFIAKSLEHIRDYQDYVENHDFDELAIFTSTQYTSPIIGSEDFKEVALSKVDKYKQEASAHDVRRVRTTPSIKKIISVTAKTFEITPKEVRISKRGQLNQAKLTSIYICRKKYGHSLSDIAREFKPISRNTVSTALSKCKKLLEDDSDTNSKLSFVSNELAP